MRYYTLFTWLTYLSVLLGVTGVAVSEGQVVYLVMMTIGCALTWPSDRVRPAAAGRIGHQVPWPIRALLVGAVLSYALADLLLLGANYVASLAHLLFFTILIKLTAKKGPRDYLQIYLMNLFSIIVAGYLSAHVIFAAILLAFVLVTTWALMLLVMAGQAQVWVKSAPDDYAPRTLDDDRVAELDRAVGVKRSRFLGRTALYTPAVLVLAILVFLLVPRGQAARARLPRSGAYTAITGFNDERVQLGDMASILQNPDPVMTVELFDPTTNERLTEPREPLLWRGLTLDEYKWKRTWGWAKSTHDQQLYRREGLLIENEENLPARSVIQQHIVLEPIDSSCLFALAPVVSVLDDRVGEIRLDREDLSLRMADPPAGLRQYDVKSVRHPWPQRGFRRRPHSRYLEVPEEIRDELRRQAERIAPDDLYSTPLGKASQMVRYFHSDRFAYSLSYRGTPGAEPVTDFLTETRKGHCELFASAMALMLRTQGIPTRLVNGFRGGEWNALGQFLVVRQQDAHSWVEAYLGPALGWRAFDPTPGPGQARPIPANSLWAYLRQSYDYLKWSWLQYVMRYDRRQQGQVLRVLGDAAALGWAALAWNLRTVRLAWAGWEGIVRRAVAQVGLPVPTGTAFTALVTAAVAVLVAVPVMVGVRRLRRRRAQPVTPVPFYRTLLNILAQFGFTRHPAQTPMEFAAQVVDAGPEGLRVVPWITQQYYRARFGGEPLPPTVQSRIRQALDQLAAGRRKGIGNRD